MKIPPAANFGFLIGGWPAEAAVEERLPNECWRRATERGRVRGSPARRTPVPGVRDEEHTCHTSCAPRPCVRPCRVGPLSAASQCRALITPHPSPFRRPRQKRSTLGLVALYFLTRPLALPDP